MIVSGAGAGYGPLAHGRVDGKLAGFVLVKTKVRSLWE